MNSYVDEIMIIIMYFLVRNLFASRATCWLRNKHWDHEVLENVLAGLPELLKSEDNTYIDNFKFAVAAGFFHKFHNYVKRQQV